MLSTLQVQTALVLSLLAVLKAEDSLSVAPSLTLQLSQAELRHEGVLTESAGQVVILHPPQNMR